jgi:hypothetical protein
MDFTPTHEIPLSSVSLKWIGFESIPPLFGDFHFQPDSPPTCPLRPVISKNTPPPSYRGCWHKVSRGFFLESSHDRALDERALQAALPFFTHVILLNRAFAHCPRFPTAAPRGSPGRISIPVWLIIRKDQLSIIGLVSLYLTNYLILLRLIKQCFWAFFKIWPELFSRFPRVTHPFATLFSIILIPATSTIGLTWPDMGIPSF